MDRAPVHHHGPPRDVALSRRGCNDGDNERSNEQPNPVSASFL